MRIKVKCEMKLNAEVINRVEAAQAQLVVVTKYYDLPQTKELIDAFSDFAFVAGWGENRTQALAEKKLRREDTHFIGRLQSRQLPSILEHCSIIHSLASLKHAAKINQLIEQNKYSKVETYVQVNVAEDPAKEGIAPKALATFLQSLTGFQNLQVVGLSAMGWGEFTESDKRQEFKTLLKLRDQYLPKGLTSAGTSRDYHLALEEGIDVVRVGRQILSEGFDE